MFKILIIEDDLVISNTVKHFLESWHYNVEIVNDFKQVLEQVQTFQPELILLDIILPFFNGYHWCTEIRKQSNVPIIFLSSASENMNIVMAVTMGGDDFISKPFDLSVVHAKIQALLRRTYSFQTPAGVLEYKGVLLHLGNTCLSYQGNTLELTKNDFRILHVLMENCGKIVARDEIMQKLWESDSFIDDNTLTVNITRLRKKLEEIGLQNFITTKKGMGYLIT